MVCFNSKVGGFKNSVLWDSQFPVFLHSSKANPTTSSGLIQTLYTSDRFPTLNSKYQRFIFHGNSSACIFGSFIKVIINRAHEAFDILKDMTVTSRWQ